MAKERGGGSIGEEDRENNGACISFTNHIYDQTSSVSGVTRKDIDLGCLGSLHIGTAFLSCHTFVSASFRYPSPISDSRHWVAG